MKSGIHVCFGEKEQKYIRTWALGTKDGELRCNVGRNLGIWEESRKKIRWKDGLWDWDGDCGSKRRIKDGGLRCNIFVNFEIWKIWKNINCRSGLRGLQRGTVVMLMVSIIILTSQYHGLIS